jgi:hypothetical protein
LNLKDLFEQIYSKKLTGKQMNMGKIEHNIINTFDQLVVYGGRLDKESLATTMELRFTDPKENALVQILTLINYLGELNPSKKENKREVTVEDIKIEEKKQEPPPPPAKVKAKGKGQ